MKNNLKSKNKAKQNKSEKINLFIPKFKSFSVFLLKSCPLSIIIFLSTFGMMRLWKNAQASNDYFISNPEKIINSSLPDGEIPRELLKELSLLQKKSRQINILDPEAPLKLKKIYNNSNWVSEIYNFQRDFSANTIEADFKIRVPAAQIKYNSYYYLLDLNGYILPNAKAKKLYYNFPEISVKTCVKPLEGIKYNCFGLDTALKVLKEFRKSLLLDNVIIKKLSVKNSSYLDRGLNKRSTLPSVEIYTADGAFIKWGTTNSESAGEPDNNQKIETIKRVLRNKGNFKSGDYLDVRTRTVYYSNAEIR